MEFKSIFDIENLFRYTFAAIILMIAVILFQISVFNRVALIVAIVLCTCIVNMKILNTELQVGTLYSLTISLFFYRTVKDIVYRLYICLLK